MVKGSRKEGSWEARKIGSWEKEVALRAGLNASGDKVGNLEDRKMGTLERESERDENAE